MIKWLHQFSQRSMNHQVTLYIALLLAFPNLPNLYFRISTADWLFAVIDITVIVLGLLIALAVFYQYRIQAMQVALSSIMVISLLLTITYGSADQLFWVFPGCVAFFFLLRPAIALLFSSSLLLVIFPLVIDEPQSTIYAFYTAMMPTVLFVFFCARELRVQHSHLSLMATEDFLTKTVNRRAFQQDTDVSIANFVRHRIPCSLILLDMDHFKRLNDTYGHNAGDKVLTHTAKLITQRLRRTDHLYRLGGEEFAILLNHGGVKEALAVAQDLQAFIRANKQDGLPEYTLSFGLAQLKSGETIDDWMMRTDKALYASKDNGRDQITTAH